MFGIGQRQTDRQPHLIMKYQQMFSFPLPQHSDRKVFRSDDVARQDNTYWNTLALDAVHHTEGRTQISKPC